MSLVRRPLKIAMYVMIIAVIIVNMVENKVELIYYMMTSFLASAVAK